MKIPDWARIGVVKLSDEMFVMLYAFDGGPLDGMWLSPYLSRDAQMGGFGLHDAGSGYIVGVYQARAQQYKAAPCVMVWEPIPPTGDMDDTTAQEKDQ